MPEVEEKNQAMVTTKTKRGNTTTLSFAHLTAQYCTQGVMQAGSNFLLNPFDKFAQEVLAKNKPANWATFSSQPWKAAPYMLRINLVRLPLMYSVMFNMQNELKSREVNTLVSHSLSGMSATVIDVALMARVNIVTAMLHTQPESCPKKAWNNIPTPQRSRTLRAAIKSSTTAGFCYWTAFPILFDFFGQYMDPVFAAMTAGGVGSFIRYPFDTTVRRSIENPSYEPFTELRNAYKQYGLFGCIRHHTHKNILKLATARTIMGAGIFGATIKPAKEIVDTLFAPEKHGI
ncbi:MAG: hypothetical protein P4M14_10680 [Gammaproteobacteria bacterium]|nr:hypothetical protein [Gammaproteobacteria bacterium]